MLPCQQRVGADTTGGALAGYTLLTWKVKKVLCFLFLAIVAISLCLSLSVTLCFSIQLFSGSVYRLLRRTLSLLIFFSLAPLLSLSLSLPSLLLGRSLYLCLCAPHRCLCFPLDSYRAGFESHLWNEVLGMRSRERDRDRYRQTAYRTEKRTASK